MGKAKNKQNQTSGAYIMHILQYIFFGILFAANLAGVFYVYSMFISITQSTPKNVTTIPDKLIPPINQALYNQIKKERSDRTLYSGSSQIQKFALPEVFKPS